MQNPLSRFGGVPPPPYWPQQQPAPTPTPTPQPGPQPTPTAPLSLRPSAFSSQWDSSMAPLASKYTAYATGGNSWDHYNLSYAVDGAASMYAATRDPKYLDAGLKFLNSVVATAKPSSSLPASQYKDGYLGWGARNHPTDPSIAGGEYPLYESYLWRYGTQLLYDMKNSGALSNPAYRAQYEKLLDFTERNVWDKWVSRGMDNLYRSRTHMTAHWGYIAMNLRDLTTDPAKRAKYDAVVQEVDRKLRGQLKVAPNGSYVWSDVWGGSGAQDVSHGNAVIAYIAESARRPGSPWTATDMQRFSNTLTKNILRSNGTYAANVDGSGTGNGWINDGFVKLGAYSPEVQARLANYGIGRGPQLYGSLAYNAAYLAR